MADNPHDEREIFICGSGGKTISYPATTITELNPEKPVRAFALPAVIHMAAASLKGGFVYTLVSLSFQLGYIFILGGAVVYGHSYSRIKNVFKLDLRKGEVTEMPPMLEKTKRLFCKFSFFVE